jgi:acetoin utilization protein AcuC
MDDLLRFHASEYLQVLKAVSQGIAVPTMSRYGLGLGDNPIFPGLLYLSGLIVGASLQAAQLMEAGEAPIAFNIGGGLHHDMPSYASGFCHLNDIVVAIDYLVARGRHVAYVDIDTHHSDGVQAAYYGSNKVLTISLHESGKYLFPGTGFESEIGEGMGCGYAVNVPLPPHTDDEVFTWTFRQIVPPLLSASHPDILVTQLGGDPFRTDPLSDLELTTGGFSSMIEMFRELSLPWVALGGGGYDVTNVPRAWSLAWAIMNDRPLSDDLPETYLESAGNLGYPHHSRQFLRDAPYRSEQTHRERAWREAERIVGYLKEHVFSLIRSA